MPRFMDKQASVLARLVGGRIFSMARANSRDLFRNGQMSFIFTMEDKESSAP